MGLNTKANFSKIICKGTAFILGLMEGSTKVTGKIIKCMVKEYMCGKMAKNM